MAAAHKSCDSYVASPFLLQCVNIWELGRSGLLSDDRYPILVWQFFTFLGDRLEYHRHPILNYSISRDSQNFLMIFYTADDEIFQSLHIIHWWILFLKQFHNLLFFVDALNLCQFLLLFKFLFFLTSSRQRPTRLLSHATIIIGWQPSWN